LWLLDRRFCGNDHQEADDATENDHALLLRGRLESKTDAKPMQRRLELDSAAPVEPPARSAAEGRGTGPKCARVATPSHPDFVPIGTGQRHRLAKVLACPRAAAWEAGRGKTAMAKVLNAGESAPLAQSFRPDPLALADRDRREALRDQQSLTAAFFGDPLPGMSALDRRRNERAH